jgi:hypothetical protein
MPPVAAPLWWEDVQQEREDFAGRSRRPVDEWLDEEVDFTPRRRLPRQSPDSAVVLELEVGAPAEAPAPGAPHHDDAGVDDDEGATVHDLHGRFVHAESARGGGVRSDTARGGAARHGARGGRSHGGGSHGGRAASPRTLDDDRFLAPPPAEGERRTVHITGRPEAARAPLPSRRHRPRTTADRVGPRPDKVALYAFILGILLILIALSSASPS